MYTYKSSYTAPKTEQHGTFFEDGERRADYVLVLAEAPEAPLTTYLDNLRDLGLEFELFEGLDTSNIFMLVHIPQETIERFSDIYNFRQEKRINLSSVTPTPLKGFSTPAHQIPVEHYDEFSSASRIVLINKILESTVYGESPNDYGLSKLIRIKKIEDAYPLHDGPLKREDDSTSHNDRQLLVHSWARYKRWYKEVPLDLVHRYFGSEIAFYFAWLQFFNFMLFPAAIIGLIVFILSLLVFYRTNSIAIEEICNDQRYLCPTCEIHDTCRYRQLSFYCTYAHWNYVFDNYLTISFAVFMSFWATIFLKFWQRKENRLILRWNATSEDSRINESKGYADRTRRRRQHKFFGTLEAHVPRYINVLYITCAISVCILLILIVFIAVFAVVCYKLTVPRLLNIERGTFLSLANSSFIQVVIIKLLTRPYEIVAVWLTLLENPRTQREFDSSVLHKQFLLSFANNYSVLFYIAFVKGHLITRPHKSLFYTTLERDICPPFGCIIPLCVQLVFLMILKNFSGKFFSALFAFAKFAYRLVAKKQSCQLCAVNSVPQFEEECDLYATDRYVVTSQFCEMIIEYGYVTFFVAAFPLAPLVALVHNILDHRYSAVKLVERCRRPVPKLVRGIGDWNAILAAVTYISVVTNAFVIAFTSDFVGREIHLYKQPSLRGYINSTISEFSTTEYEPYVHMSADIKVCYYGGQRLPPDDPNKYSLRMEYWLYLIWRLICVFVFEHLIAISTAIVRYTIPSIPWSVRTQFDIDRKLTRMANMKEFTSGRATRGLSNIRGLEHYVPKVDSNNADESMVSY